MTPESIRQTARDAIACFNDPSRRDEYFERLYDDDVVLHGYTPAPLVGKPTVQGFYGAIFAAFPDCRVETLDLFVEGDHLTWRFGFSGTHEGDFQGVPATGRRFDIPGITILRFGDRRCRERWSVADFLGLMMQIGAIPAPVG